MYKAAQLDDAIERYHGEITSTCNPAHIIARAWIALPYPVSLTEEQADRVFDALKAWETEKAA